MDAFANLIKKMVALFITTVLFLLMLVYYFGDKLPRISRVIQTAEKAEIYIQAGHEGRKSGRTGAASAYGKEIEWTPIVADEATRILRAAGYTVIRAKADHRRKSKVVIAISLHFDGSAKPCRTGASIGYDDPTDKPAADAWKALYKKHFPYKWMPDNFTKNLSHYYNFRYTYTSDAELVLELGDITCKKQAEWLAPKLEKIGALVAYFAASRVDENPKVQAPNLLN